MWSGEDLSSGGSRYCEGSERQVAGKCGLIRGACLNAHGTVTKADSMKLCCWELWCKGIKRTFQQCVLQTVRLSPPTLGNFINCCMAMRKSNALKLCNHYCIAKKYRACLSTNTQPCTYILPPADA